MKYRSYKRRPSKKHVLLLIASIIALALVVTAAGVVYVRNQYMNNLQPVSGSLQTKYFTVEQGSAAKEIARNLEADGLIKDASAFEWYLRTNNLRDKLQAGTYVLSPSMTSQQIANKMVEGDVAKNLLTILPGKRLDQVKRAFVAAGYNQQEIDSAFNPTQYKGHPALVSLTEGSSLEGYLYPDSFERTSATPASAIIRASLDEMAEKLTPDLQAGLAAQRLDLRQALILSSIVLQESGNPNDQPTVAQVFMKRFRSGILLQSDPTAVYASVLAGVEPDLSIDSPYNTYVSKGLPPGPIGNVTESALSAVANPSNTDFLYFVAGDDGTTHFSKTLAEHEQNIQKYCTTLCGR